MPKAVSVTMWEADDGSLFKEKELAIQHNILNAMIRILGDSEVIHDVELPTRLAKDLWRRGYKIEPLDA